MVESESRRIEGCSHGKSYTEELPGAISEGDTLEEARENLRDAIELLLEANRELASQSHRGKKVARKKINFPVSFAK